MIKTKSRTRSNISTKISELMINLKLFEKSTTLSPMLKARKTVNKNMTESIARERIL